jgi:hypothetical protein
MVEKHYTVIAYDTANAIPLLNDKENWIYLYHDTEYPGVAPSFNLAQLEILLQRNNFAVYSHDHFYPLPTTPSLIDELDRAFTSLAERLLENFAGVIPRSYLIVLPTPSLESTPDRPLPLVPAKRHYHDTVRVTPTPHPSDTFISVPDSPDRTRDDASSPGIFMENTESPVPPHSTECEEKKLDETIKEELHLRQLTSTAGDTPTPIEGETVDSITGTEWGALPHSEQMARSCATVPWTDPTVTIGLFKGTSPPLAVPILSDRRVGIGTSDKSWTKRFTVHKVPGDGECFFSSVNDLMN